MSNEIRSELVQLARRLGQPAMAMAILGEGNVSGRVDDDSFLVKASGSQLSDLQEEQLTQVDFASILQFLDTDGPKDEAVSACLESSKIIASEKRPSVETFMHAVCLSEAGAKYVGHTHPEFINAVACSKHGLERYIGPIFPDQIVVCGLHWLVIPYVDPGIELAKLIRSELGRFQKKHGYSPKLILLENHGAVALGQSIREVSNILEMAHKWARIVVNTAALGGPKFMPEALARRIDGRDDEEIRRKALGM